jgi:hypothetical protein
MSCVSINPILEQHISVDSTLKELALEHLEDIFMREEVRNVSHKFYNSFIKTFQLQINTMAIFFTLTNADLELIGIEDENDRKKILDFIGSVKTPIKSKAYRH